MAENIEPCAKKVEYNEEEKALDDWAIEFGRKVKKGAYKKNFNDESF